MFKKLIRWFFSFFKKEKTLKYVYVGDNPDELLSGIIYIVQNEGFNWQVMMQCPCGCKETIQLNLMEGSSPRWKFFTDKGSAITLTPSVWRTVGCESHFFVRSGEIEWV